MRESLEPREQPQGAEYGDQATAQTLSLSGEQEAVGGALEGSKQRSGVFYKDRSGPWRASGPRVEIRNLLRG